MTSFQIHGICSDLLVYIHKTSILFFRKKDSAPEGYYAGKLYRDQNRRFRYKHRVEIEQMQIQSRLTLRKIEEVEQRMRDRGYTLSTLPEALTNTPTIFSSGHLESESNSDRDMFAFWLSYNNVF
jgi:hypothetical protein